MNTTFDYLGSVVVGGMIVVIVLTLNSNIVSSAFQRNLDLSTQEAATNLLAIVENDLKRAGYFHQGNPFVHANRYTMAFLGDVNDDGIAELVTYRTGDSTELAQTKNTSDRPLYRRIGSTDSLNVASGLVRFSLSYFDSERATIPYDSLTSSSSLARVRMIRVSLRMEPPDPLDTTFIPVELNRIVAPRNLGGW